MPKNKKPRKKYKAPTRVVKPLHEMDIKTQIKTLFPKTPHCKYCGTECVLAPEEDVKAYKEYDTSYKFDFIYVPECSCWETKNDWMEV